jgi:DNA-binding GntR family transcriptional regulator
MARNRDPFASALRTLRERAIAGAFSPGKPIIILDEAQSLGLSTTPIREALAWLGGEGLIERAPAGGYAGLRLDPAGLASRYRLRLHCLEKGLEAAAPGISASSHADPTRLFRHIVAGAADLALMAVYDRVQATIERFAETEARLLGDMPEALEAIADLLADGQVSEAAAGLRDFHERRISAAPLLTEAEQVQAGAG